MLFETLIGWLSAVRKGIRGAARFIAKASLAAASLATASLAAASEARRTEERAPADAVAGGPLLDGLAFAVLKHRVPTATWEAAPDYFRDHLRGQALPVLRALGEVVGDEALDLVKRIRAGEIGPDGRMLFLSSDEQAAALVAALLARRVANSQVANSLNPLSFEER